MWYKLAQDQPENNNVKEGVYRMPLQIPVSNTLTSIMRELSQLGMSALLVGGCVRDALMGYKPKDIDVEVYGVDFETLAKILKKYGKLANGAGDSNNEGVVGKAFGVIKFTDPEGNDYDFSLPRKDSKTGAGHKDFNISVDPNMNPREAAARRDFTINALAWNPLTQEIHDYYGGVGDIKNKVLRATSPAFKEDALRVLRGMQFSARFGMHLDPGTAEMCKEVMEEYKYLPKERISEEWMKLVTKGKTPGSAWRFLIDSGWIELYPRLQQLVGVPQEFEYHPEGEVEIHTEHVMNAMAEICDREGIQGDSRAVLNLAALTHDLAKSLPEHGGTTVQMEKGGKMRWTSHGHEAAGGPMAKELLESMGIKKDIITKVVPLVENHLAHITFDPQKTPPALLRKLADKIYPATIEELALLMEADHSGRPPLEKKLPDQAKWMLEQAKNENVHMGKPEPLIKGRDVMRFGLPAGPAIGEVVKQGYQAQLNGQIHNEEDAEIWLKKTLRPKVAIINGNHPIFAELGIKGPELGKTLNDAYEAQLAGMYSTGSEADNWIREYLLGRQ